MKTRIIIRIIIIGAIILLALQWRSASQSNKNAVTNISSPTPNPNIPFALKQQCSNDAINFFNGLQSRTIEIDKSVHGDYVLAGAKYTLHGYTYNQKLNTCLVAIHSYPLPFNNNQGRLVNGVGTDEVFDVLNQKLLAFYDTDSNQGDIPDKFLSSDNPSYTNLSVFTNYQSSLGL